MIPKFRFWYEREDYYPDENYMRDVWKIEYITDSKIELNDDYIFNPYTNEAENIYAKTKIYLMQSTGLKDKNGVEIYEGDIVRLTEKTINGGIYNHTCKVFQSKSGAWRLEGRPDFSKEYTTKRELYSVRNRVEIIGNVWENPELLEVHNASE